MSYAGEKRAQLWASRRQDKYRTDPRPNTTKLLGWNWVTSRGVRLVASLLCSSIYYVQCVKMIFYGYNEFGRTWCCIEHKGDWYGLSVIEYMGILNPDYRPKKEESRHVFRGHSSTSSLARALIHLDGSVPWNYTTPSACFCIIKQYGPSERAQCSINMFFLHKSTVRLEWSPSEGRWGSQRLRITLNRPQFAPNIAKNTF